MTINQLRGENVLASDGPVGSLHDIYFDDQGWTVRYFLVDTGECLPGGLLLVPPGAVADDVALERGMRLALTREQARALVHEDSRHLRSGTRLLGFSVEGADGALGEVQDFSVDERWRITGLMVGTERQRVEPQRVGRIDLAQRKLFLK